MKIDRGKEGESFDIMTVILSIILTKRHERKVPRPNRIQPPAHNQNQTAPTISPETNPTEVPISQA